MPPRLTSAVTACCRAAARPAAPSASTSLLTAALAGLSIQTTPPTATTQTRAASILSSLKANPGAVKSRKRVGRGASSGHGKTSGRGNNGQKQHGHVKPWFQGGQTPLIRKLGQKGFVNHRAPKMSTVNLDRIQTWIDQGRLDPNQRITPKELIESRLIGSPLDGVKILSRGSNVLKQPIDVLVSRVSSSAIEAIESAGGKVVTRYYTRQAIKRLLKGESVNTDEPLPQGAEHVQKVLDERRKIGWLYRLPDPTGREDIEYYRDPAHRGYLSHQLKEGENPSLYWKVPGTEKIKSAPKPKTEVEEMLW